MANVNNLHPAPSLLTCDTATAPLSPRGEETTTQKSASINTLPTEILEIIFIHCAFDYYHEDHDQYTTSRVPSWVNVSYVSRHWRHVALNCPTLWTYLFITSPRWMEELLARSKQASLKLHAYLCTPYEPCFEQVMNHPERIQELFLDIRGVATIVFANFSFSHALLVCWKSFRITILQLGSGHRYPLMEILRPSVHSSSEGVRCDGIRST